MRSRFFVVGIAVVLSTAVPACAQQSEAQTRQQIEQMVATFTEQSIPARCALISPLE